MSKPSIGITFSELRLAESGVSLSDGIEQAVSLGVNYMRICAYWNRFERIQGDIDLASFLYSIERCQEQKIDVICAIGMKSPRWPEFHLPSWVNEVNRKESLLSYLETIVTHCKKYSCITHWQIENEPLDPSGPDGLTIPVDLLQAEIDLVKRLDGRPIMFTVWGNELSRRKILSKLPRHIDAIGVDLYYKVPRLFGYSHPVDSDTSIDVQLGLTKKQIFVTELQAEPWEATPGRKQTPSMNPELLRRNVERVQRSIKAQAILLWGFEYWLEQKIKGDARMWETVKQLI